MAIISPYIGVTGFMAPKEVQNFLDIIGIFDLKDRMIMIGVLASLKTLLGQPAGNPKRYPLINRVANIFPPRSTRLLNLVHYNTSEPETLLDQLCRLADLVGPNCDGFQLNMYWPDYSVLETFKKRHPTLKLVLQIGGKSLRAISSPDALALKVRSYLGLEVRDLGLINHVLLDPSCGTGQPFDVDIIRIYLGHLNVFRDKIGLGIAGGLSPDNIEPCRVLLERYPGLSFDVESGVRNPDDTLNIISASLYTQRLLEMMG